MTKAEIVNEVAKTTGIEKTTVAAVVESFMECVKGSLAKGNPVYDKCHKTDKYVQVYEFKTVADCKKFMAEQQKRVG